MKRNRHQRKPDEGYEETDRRSGPEDAHATNGNPLGLEDLPPPSQPKPWRWFGLFAFVLVSLAMLATVLVVTVAEDKKTSLLKAEEERLRESVLGRAKVLQTWLEGQVAPSRRLTDSHVFRLFVTDLTLQKPGSPLPRSLQDQRPYFRQLMADFARQNDLLRAAIIRVDGTILLSSSGPPLPVASLLQQFEGAEPDRPMLLSPIRILDDQNGLAVIDAMIAFPKAQTEGEMALTLSAVLVMTLPVGPILEDVLSHRLAAADHEDIILLQKRDNITERIRMTREGVAIRNDQSSDTPMPGSSVAFHRRDDGKPVYALGEPVKGVPWTLYHSIDARAALAPVHGFVKVVAGFSLVAALALTAAFSAFWWRHGRNHHRQLVRFYKAHAQRVEHQRQFLQSVTTSIGDWLTVSGPDGKLIYANPAFETAIGRSGSSVLGKAWCDFAEESSPKHPPENDLLELTDADMFDVVEINGYQHIVSARRSRILAADGSTEGTIQVVRDHTKLVAERRRRLSSVTQTVNAFIHAIELRDPFLLGHTGRVRKRAIAVGKKLGLTRDDLASLALAASLSQIGKIFTPDHILTKPDRHTADEEAIMRDHILHTIGILEHIDFDLPIVGILGSMHERLDGSGYPNGLTGDQIGLSARILGVVDVFCARTAPRSYRDRMNAGKVLYHLANNGQRYDLNVVAALAGIVDHGEETADIDGIEQGFVDSTIWLEKYRELDSAHETA